MVGDCWMRVMRCMASWDVFCRLMVMVRKIIGGQVWWKAGSVTDRLGAAFNRSAPGRSRWADGIHRLETKLIIGEAPSYCDLGPSKLPKTGRSEPQSEVHSEKNCYTELLLNACTGSMDE